MPAGPPTNGFSATSAPMLLLARKQAEHSGVLIRSLDSPVQPVPGSLFAENIAEFLFGRRAVPV
jgi:hypothetical protein